MTSFTSMSGHYRYLHDCLVHYFDEGQGLPILLLHGIPVWSFTFRDLIGGLQPSFRCIAPDMPGFGLSLAAPDFGFAPESHEEVLSALVEELDLDQLLIMGFDWGGPLALKLALRHPRRVRGIILGNTWAWPDNSVTAARTLRSALVRRAVVAPNVVRSSRFLIRFALRFPAPRLRLDRDLEQAYLHRYPTRESRRGPSELVYQNLLNATGRSSYMASLENDLARLQHIPVLLTWGARCPVFTAVDRRRFEAAFPRHRSLVFPWAGHFVHEEEPELVAAAIRNWAGSVLSDPAS
jgi:haloalkane dehalogenase